MHVRQRIAIVLARLRLPAVAVIIAFMVADRLLGFVPGGWAGWLAWVVLLAVLYVLVRGGTVRREPVVVRPPVAGRWLALNGPTSRVPSHGVQAYGQTYAVDLVYDPADDPAGRTRPRFAWSPLARRPRDFPGFGQPVVAPANGRVVRVHDRERDHWSRTSPLALAYLFTVELLRDLLGPSRVLGNHVVLDIGDGNYAVAAHLRRRSVRVAVGQHVRAGDQLAECGNSGNTTEPHVHFQLQDHPRPVFAAGIPFRFTDADGVPVPVPNNGQHLAAASAPDPRAYAIPDHR
jgi:hypothetical protein